MYRVLQHRWRSTREHVAPNVPLMIEGDISGVDSEPLLIEPWRNRGCYALASIEDVDQRIQQTGGVDGLDARYTRQQLYLKLTLDTDHRPPTTMMVVSLEVTVDFSANGYSDAVVDERYFVTPESRKMSISRFFALMLDRSSKGTPHFASCFGPSFTMQRLAYSRIGPQQEYPVRTSHSPFYGNYGRLNNNNLMITTPDIQHQNGNFSEEFEELWEDVDPVRWRPSLQLQACIPYLHPPPLPRSVLSQDVLWATEAFGLAPDVANLWIGDERSVTSLHKGGTPVIFLWVDGCKELTRVRVIIGQTTTKTSTSWSPGRRSSRCTLPRTSPSSTRYNIGLPRRHTTSELMSSILFYFILFFLSCPANVSGSHLHSQQ